MPSQEALAKLAEDMFYGRVFTSTQLPDGINDPLIPSIFMPIIFMDDEQRQKMIDTKPVLFYGYYTDAGPMAINGYPTLFSFGYLGHEDALVVFERVTRMRIAVDSVKEQPANSAWFTTSPLEVSREIST